MSGQRLAGLSITLAGLALSAGPTRGESWQNEVSARVSTEYDTNPLLDPAFEGGIWLLRVEPSYTLTRASDGNELKAGLGALLEHSSDKILSQDRSDPSVFLDWRHQGERGVSGMSARYDEVATRFAELDRTGPFLADGTRASRTLSANWSRELSERTTLAVDGEYTNFTYKGGTFTDYATKAGNIMFSRAWSEYSVPFLKVSYLDFAPSDGGPIDRRYSAMLGAKLKPLERLDVTVQGGQSQSEGGNLRHKIGGMAVQYTGQLTKWSLDAGRQVEPSGLGVSGLGGFILADQVSGSWSRDISERRRIGIDLLWRRSYLDVTNLYRTAGAWLQRDLNSEWGMRMYYLHKISELEAVYVASENVFGFSLTYTSPNF